MKNIVKHNEWKDSKTLVPMVPTRMVSIIKLAKKFNPLQCRGVNLKLVAGKDKVTEKQELFPKDQ